MSDIYHTILSPSEGAYTDKRSKFLSFAFPVVSVEEAKAYISSLSKKYYDARHVCWAYMIGASREVYMSNDNGEPSGTAGKPILGQINSFGLTDILIVVVRYFGGIKLGTSGLIIAYREAAKEAISSAEIVERHVMDEICFRFPYMSMNDVMRLAKAEGVKIVSQEFDNSCSMCLKVRMDASPELRQRLLDVDGLTMAE
jgi:uncharacterized YigZ family protein